MTLQSGTRKYSGRGYLGLESFGDQHGHSGFMAPSNSKLSKLKL